MLTVVSGDGSGHESGRGSSGSLIDEIVREGARWMLAEALQAQVDAYIAAFAAERDENAPAAGRTEWLSSEPGDPDQRGRDRGDGAAGQRQAHRPGHRAAQAVLLRDRSALVPQDPGDHRGAAAAVPARPVQRGLRARAGAVPGLIGWPVAGGDHEADRDVEDRAACLRRPGPVRGGLRLPVGRRHPREHPPRRAQAVPAGHDRRARRWPQRAHRPGRWVP
jgi:hypothetical protein